MKKIIAVTGVILICVCSNFVLANPRCITVDNGSNHTITLQGTTDPGDIPTVAPHFSYVLSGDHLLGCYDHCLVYIDAENGKPITNVIAPKGTRIIYLGGGKVEVKQTGGDCR